MEHISFTQLNMLLRCGEQYRRRYVQGEILPPSGSQVRGRSAHKAEEMNFVQKIESNTDLPLEAVRDFFSDEWEKGKYGIVWTPEELGDDTLKKAEAKYKDQGISLVSVYHCEIAPKAAPAHVEKKFTVEFEGGYPSLMGIIDRVDRDDSVNDAKFVSKSPSEGDAKKDTQLVSYQLGFQSLFGRPPRKLRKEYAISTKTPKTAVQEIEPHDRERMNRFLWTLERAMEAISKGVFLPAALGSWACSKKFCGFWNSCVVKQGLRGESWQD